jgi:energy-coupling factor transporter transmembrane protein EcfT
MANRLANPFAFEPGKSSLATLHPLAKLTFLLAVTSVTMWSGVGLLLGLFAIGFFLLIPLPRAASGTLSSILLLVMFAALVRGILPGDGRLFDAATLPDSGVYALRLFTVYIYSRLFYATTRVSEIGDWMTAAIRAVRRPFRGRAKATKREPGLLGDPGMLFSLVLLFLPRIFDTYQRTKEAGEVRGIMLSRRNLRRSLVMLEQLIVGSIEQAWRTAVAMEVRGYSPERSIRLTAFAGRDWGLLVLAIALFFLKMI